MHTCKQTYMATGKLGGRRVKNHWHRIFTCKNHWHGGFYMSKTTGMKLWFLETTASHAAPSYINVKKPLAGGCQWFLHECKKPLAGGCQWFFTRMQENHSIPTQCFFLHRLAPAQPRKRRSRDARCEATLRSWENKSICEVGVPWPARPIRRTRFPDIRTSVKKPLASPCCGSLH